MSINRTIVTVRNTPLSTLANCLNGIAANVPSLNLQCIGNGGNSAILTPFCHVHSVAFTPHVLIKSPLPYVHRLVQALLSVPLTTMCIAVHPSYVLSSTIPSSLGVYKLAGSLDTIMAIDPTALHTLASTPSIYNHGRYAVKDSRWNTPEKMLRDMGTRSGWNMSLVWT